MCELDRGQFMPLCPAQRQSRPNTKQVYAHAADLEHLHISYANVIFFGT